MDQDTKGEETSDKKSVPRSQKPFRKGDFVVYPAHGVGQVESTQTLEVDGEQVRTIAVLFQKDRMLLRIPEDRIRSSTLRHISTRQRLTKAMSVLHEKPRIRRAMWSRRAQEYEEKIQTGEPLSIVEVLRELHRSGDQGEQSYSERQMYQIALERLAKELAVVEKISEDSATQRIENLLAQKEGEAKTKEKK